MKKKNTKNFIFDTDFKTFTAYSDTMSFWPACFGRSGPIKKFWFETYMSVLQKLKPVL